MCLIMFFFLKRLPKWSQGKGTGREAGVSEERKEWGAAGRAPGKACGLCPVQGPDTYGALLLPLRCRPRTAGKILGYVRSNHCARRAWLCGLLLLCTQGDLGHIT